MLKKAGIPQGSAEAVAFLAEQAASATQPDKAVANGAEETTEVAVVTHKVVSPVAGAGSATNAGSQATTTTTSAAAAAPDASSAANLTGSRAAPGGGGVQVTSSTNISTRTAKRKKKKKQKYADQDEEDRALRIELLQAAATGVADPAAPAPRTKREKRKQKREARKERGDVGSKRKQQATGAQGMELPVEVLEYEAEIVAATQARLEAGQAAHDADEVGAIMREENLMTAEELEALSILDSLTGQPHEDDVILFAVPVVAPYAALTRFKYKAKMVPGTSKKGKTARQSLHKFTTLARPREKDVMKAIKENDLFVNLPGKVKLM